MGITRPAALAFLGVLALVTVAGGTAAADAPDCSTVTYDTDTDGALLIDNVDKLQCMNDSLSEDYRLANDIDASETSSWNNGSGFTPVGPSSSTPFTGSLDGDGHAVTGLYINRSDSGQGLFGYMDGVVVRDLGLEDVYVESTGLSAPLGADANRTEVYDTYTTGEVYDNGGCCTAGLISDAVVQSSDTVGNVIKNVSTDVYVNASGCCGGGLFYFFGGGTIEDSHAEGDVYSENCCSGGLASFITANGGAPVEVRNSYATGDVNDSGCCAGGFAGFIYASSTVSPQPSVSVEDSYATGDLNASFNGGGCCNGGFAGYIEDITVVRDSYATGDVDGDCCNGGFTSEVQNNAVVNDSYSTGNVSGRFCCQGGFAAFISDNTVVRDSYSTGNTTDETNCCTGGFAGQIYNDAVVNDTYSTGDVSAGDCCTGGYTGGVYDDAVVRDSFSTGDVEGKFCCVGGFLGESSATSSQTGRVLRSVSTGDVEELGGGDAGGFAGYVDNVDITESYSTGDAESNESSVGGFVGYVTGGTVINESYARGDATGNDSVGGFAGYYSGDRIEQVYSTGVPTATNASATDEGGLVGLNDSGGPIASAYWDEEASGTSVSDGGTALTTSQMTGGTNPPLTMIGFDFTNTWSTTSSYPILRNSPDLSFLFEDGFVPRRDLGRGEADRGPRMDRDIGRGESRREVSQERDTRRRSRSRSRGGGRSR